MSVTVALLLFAAGQAVPATFYNRPGAAPGDVTAALRQCRAIATGPMGGSAVLGPALGPPTTVAGPAPPPTDAIEDCMIARGWRLFAHDSRAHRRLATMQPAARARALARLERARRPANSRLIREDRRLLLRAP